jgi:hypothetical protein
MRLAFVIPFLIPAVLCAAGHIAFAQHVVTLRPGSEWPRGEVVGVGVSGVTVKVGGRADVLVPWDQVSEVPTGDWGDRQLLAEVAQDAWRARVRIERGDFAGAEQILERLFARLEGEPGPTAELCAEGLLAARLLRGAQALAVRPWLATISARAGQPGREVAQRGLPSTWPDIPLIDRELLLAPALPPIWLESPAVIAVAQARWPSHSAVVAPLDVLYRVSMQQAAGVAGDSMPPRPADGTPHQFVWDIIASHGADASLRAQSRDRLRAMMETGPSAWVQVWCRVGVGRSLMLEQDEESWALGIAELAAVPAAYERVVPYLTGVAMAEMARGLLRLGQTDRAVAMRRLLARRFPSHPALDWEPLRNWNVSELEQPSPEPGLLGTDDDLGGAP